MVGCSLIGGFKKEIMLLPNNGPYIILYLINMVTSFNMFVRITFTLNI